MLKEKCRWILCSLVIILVLGCGEEKVTKQEPSKEEKEAQVVEKLTPKVKKEPTPKVKKEPTPKIKKEIPPKASPQEATLTVKESIPKCEEGICRFPLTEVPDEIKWYTSMDEALKVAKQENKPLMVDFTAPWCYWCRRLDETTYKDKEVISLAQKFVSVKVDCDKELAIAQKYKIRGLPTIIFMDSDGKVLHTIVGYRNPKDFIVEMNKVIKGGE